MLPTRVRWGLVAKCPLLHSSFLDHYVVRCVQKWNGMTTYHLPELVHYLVAMDYRYTMIYTNNKGVGALCSVLVCIICCAGYKCLNCLNGWKKHLKIKKKNNVLHLRGEAETRLHLCCLSSTWAQWANSVKQRWLCYQSGGMMWCGATARHWTVFVWKWITARRHWSQ